MVPTMGMPHPGVPVHRAYLMSAGPAYHHPIVHPSVPSMTAAAYPHIPHPTLVPARHPTIPFPNRDAGLGLFMNEEEFYRAKKKLQET